MVSLSVLDQVPVPSGATSADALLNSVDLAQRCEALGFRRYWVAEHHGTDGLAGSAPEVLIAHIGANTRRIRVGSGGVMLPHYSPFKVAEVFHLLASLQPGRIDLGLGRAPGGTPVASLALQRDRSHPPGDDFLEQLAELRAWLEGDFPENHTFAKLHATPTPPSPPELWLLSSSGYSAQAAAHFGTGLCFAHFINAHGGPEAMSYYREHFTAYQPEDTPRSSIAVRVVCADTTEEAQRLATSADLWRLRQRRFHEYGTVPTPDEAIAYNYSEFDQAAILDARSRVVIGNPSFTYDRLNELAKDYGVDEIVVVTITHDHRARIRSYELLAESFGLQPMSIEHLNVQ